ncbi:MAG: hypothetical protein Q8O83_04815 [bacterium]|nr:hypothetical protein [bacterium]
MKTVFLFIGNPVYASDLLRTDYIAYLASQFRVVVFLPEAMRIDTYPAFPTVEYRSLPLYNKRLWAYAKEFRLTLNRVNETWAETLFNRERFDVQHRRTLRIIARVFPRGLIRNALFTFFENFFTRKLPELGKAVGELSPALFLVPAPGLNPFEAQAVIQAKKFKIPSVAINFSWDNLTSNFSHVRKTDYIICWNDLEYKDALSLHGYKKSSAFISGPIRFDRYFRDTEKHMTREQFLLEKGLDPKKKTLLFTSVTKNYPFQKDLVRRIVALRNTGAIRGCPNIFLRVHPLDTIETYNEFRSIPYFYIEKAGQEYIGSTGKTYVEMSEKDLINLKRTLLYADCNMNHVSTITIEASIVDTPVVNITFDDIYGLMYKQRHYAPVLEHKAAILAKTDDELAYALNRYFEDPSLHREGRKNLVRDFIPYQDGLSYKRNVEVLHSIISSITPNS